MKRTLLIFSITLFFLVSNRVYSQDIINTNYKNTIHWNITPMVVVGPKSIVFGYERMVNSWQSFSVNIGYLEMAPYTNEDGEVIQIFDENNKGGFDISADYRYYFKNRNKFAAPDGLYWGPYTAYYALWNDASMKIIDNGVIKNTANISTNFHMLSGGVQLGYQFVLKERFTIDLILMGPSLTYYNMNAELDFNLTIDPNDPIYKEIYEKILDASPKLAAFVESGEFSTNGRIKFLSYGFRYGIHLGYRF